MLVEGSGRRIFNVDEHIGAAVAGLLPDARQLITRARDESQGYKQNFGEQIPPQTLADRMGGFMHLFTVYWYFRPSGAAVLLAGYDRSKDCAELYCAEPNGQALVSVPRCLAHVIVATAFSCPACATCRGSSTDSLISLLCCAAVSRVRTGEGCPGGQDGDREGQVHREDSGGSPAARGQDPPLYP